MNRNKQATLFLVSMLCFYFFLSTDLWGQSPKREVAVGQISAEVLPLITRARQGAPLPIDLRIFNNSNQLLTGELVVQAKEDTYQVYEHRFDLTLTKGEQAFHHLLPVQFYNSYSGQIDLQLYFETDSTRYDLDFHPVQLAQATSYNLTVGFCVPETNRISFVADKYKQREHLLKDWLEFKEFLQPPQESINDPEQITYRPSLITIFSQFSRESLPQHPLEFTCFDLLVFWEESFAELSAKQLAAFEQWVQAGGNAIIITGASLDEEHLNALNRLSGSPTDDPYFYQNPENKLAWNKDQLADHKFIRNQHELGRVVVMQAEVFKKFQKHKTEKELNHLFIWNVRLGISEQYLESSNIRLDKLMTTKEKVRLAQRTGRSVQELERQGNTNEFGLDLFTTTQITNELQNSRWTEPYLNTQESWISLLPTGFQIVPPAVIRYILIGYLLLIGPVDFFLLGLIKKRRWTWITFPLITICVTVFTIYLVNSYMEIQSPSREIRFVDIGSQGQILRTNSINCLMSSTHKTDTKEFQQELVSTISTQNQWQPRQMFLVQQSNNSGTESSIPLFAGSLTGKSSLTQNLNKWSPVMRVKFSIPDNEQSKQISENQLCGFPWHEITYDKLNSQDSRKLLTTKMEQVLGKKPDIFLLHGDRSQTITQTKRNHNSGWIDTLTRRQSLSRLLNYTAPRPGKFQENVSLFDAHNPDDYCLVLIHQNESQTIVERRLFRAKDNK